jgi:sensor histidine kinase YesM
LNNVFFEYAFVTNNGRDTLLLEKYITHPTIDLKYLPHGRYQLHITAFKHGRKMDESRIEVRVKPTLIENSTFWIALIGAIIAFFLYVFWQQRALFKRDKAIDQLSKDFEKTRIQSLVSTFNPHFINNSLHWVQSKYAHDKDLTTVIGRLSKNITMIINNSRRGKAHHSLEQELQLVDNYVQIQRIRFSNSFEYRLDIKDEQLKKINLPLMQIQIHVENAIEHGIRNRRASKLVNVKIENDNDFLIIQIIDDGVGRAKAKNLKSQRTQSGTLMLNNVQEFLNKKNKLHISTRYVDNIYGDHGTKVEIKIPLNYTYEL